MSVALRESRRGRRGDPADSHVPRPALGAGTWEAAEPGNGNMVAIVVKERAQVDALHAKALALGGTDEGAPGVRGKEGPQAFYGAYFRDLDGNKLCAFRIGPAS